MKKLLTILFFAFFAFTVFGQIPLSSNFGLSSGISLDNRLVKADITERNAIPAVSRYEGMTVYVTDDSCSYQLIGGVTDANWENAPYSKVIDTNTTIYAETTGNDFTGDGSVGLPFATLARAIQHLENTLLFGCKVTIQLGIGNFEVNKACLIAMKKVHSVFTGNIVIKGTTLASGQLTLTEVEANSGRYTVTEGLASADLYYNYILVKNLNIGYPIGKHNTSEIRLSKAGLLGAYDILLLQTSVTAVGEITGTPNSSGVYNRYLSNLVLQFGSAAQEFQNFCSALISYRELIIEVDAGIRMQGKLHAVHFYGSILKPSTLYDTNNESSIFLYEVSPGDEAVSFRYSYIDVSNSTRVGRVLYSYHNSEWKNTRVVGNNTQDCFQFFSAFDYYNMSELLIEGFLHGFYNAYGTIHLEFYGLGTRFIDCGTAIYWRTGSLKFGRKYTPEIYLYNVDYLLQIAKAEALQVYLPSEGFVGTPNLAWLHPSSVNDGYYDPSIQMDIIIPGIFREVDFINDETLTDNSITYLIVGDTVQNRSIHLQYTIVRGTAYQEGVLRILYDGTNVFILDDFQNNGSSLGVTFTTDINGTEIRLVATVTNTGTDATFKATVKRIMI